jgi:hypothetical protein
MSIVTKIRNFLEEHGPATIKTIAEAISELNQCGGEERTLLLMRLNPIFEQSKVKLWFTRWQAQSDEDAIIKAAAQYFVSLGRHGAYMPGAVTEISKITKLEAKKVKQILTNIFLVDGTNIFNRPKQQEEK